MKAFKVALRAVISFYNELFFLIGLSLLWWATGGVFVGLAIAFGYVALSTNGVWWIAPILAIPAGPAIIALAAVVRRCVRDQHVDRSQYFEAYKTQWKQGLALNAIGMVILSLLLLNLIFYLYQTTTVLRVFGIIWGYLTVFWLSVQLYVYPFFVALEKPTVLSSLRMAALAVLANPLFSLLLLVLAGLVTAVNVALAITVLIAWPALMALLGEHGLVLILELAGMKKDAGDSES